jgi:Nucleotidyl transferase AbiEii toxin, Type IV TA system
MILQMAHFDRSRSPVIIDTVPVLDIEDAVGWKVHAFLTRVEPRDAYDVAMALGRYSIEQLIGFALRAEPSLLPEEFAEAARNLDATTDGRFARIGLAPDVITLIRRRLAAWPRDPSQVPGASASRPQPNTAVRSGRHTSRLRRYPSGGS